MLIKKGMKVRVISGAHKGQEGKVLFSSPKKQRVVVEGVNFIKKSTRPSQENPNGGIVEKELSINLSNLGLMNKGKLVKVGFGVDKNGKRFRINKKNGNKID